jgi:tetratricopeptide (TPR) repeat protein
MAQVATSLLFLTATAFAQTGSIAGVVKGEDGKPLEGATVKMERQEIKGSYKVNTKKKGDFFHAGLPTGMYVVNLEVGGKQVASDKARVPFNDTATVNFDLQALKVRSAERMKAAESGVLTQEQAKEMTPEERAAMEKNLKERQAAMAKNKALNDTFNAGMTAMQAKQFDQAIENFIKASEMDPKQVVVWQQLAESYAELGKTKTGDEQKAAYAKAVEVYPKAIELKPEDSGTHNNFGILLARAGKFEEAQAELAKAAQLEPPKAGMYYFNLGAILMNNSQLEAAGDAFKKATEADPNHAEAHYQYGIYLIGKATTTADGKVTPVPGTKEAFQKYIELAPTGPNADGAKAMLTTLDSSLSTEYQNPDAKKKNTKKK